MHLKITGLLICLTCLVPFGLRADFKEVSGSLVEQRTFIIKSESLRTMTREPFLLLRDSRMLSTRDIQRACNKFAHAQKAELVYTPDDGKCVRLTQYKSRNPKFRLNSFLLAGQSQAQLDELISTSDILLINPRPQGVAFQCACPSGNRAPVVLASSGSPQSTESGTPIAPIVFSASDADGDHLTHSYSYTLDGAPFNGLPTGLSEACSSSAGALQCSINGTAPAETGEYLVDMTVSDGSSSRSATASLTVTPPIQADGIFDDSFEDL